MESKALGDAAHQLAEAAEKARGWVLEVRQHAARVASEAPSLIDLSRRVEIAARRLGRAAGQRTSVGVFGPSQSGKSYLVSRLGKGPPDAAGAEERLVADLGDRELDFLKEINPPGDKESTGLVTRFSTEHRPTPAGYPVALQLLGETDLVRILANSYLSDFDVNRLELDPPPPPPDAVRALLGELRRLPRDAVVAPHLTELELFGLRDYFAGNFPARVGWLEEVDYWGFALGQACRLALPDRARLFGVLWGGIPEFTELYQRLARGLAELGFASEAYAAIEALEPRERSIIDVERITRDLGTAADDRDPVKVLGVRDGGRRAASLPRGVLCALVAELHITLRNRTYPLLERIDLLDFPGARSREKLRSMRERTEAERELARRPSELLIRGKVAVLFERYTEELGLAAMLLCMPGGNAEVKDLGHLVFEWIKATHGATAAERAGQRNALFLVLTKSDLDFKTKEGEDEVSRKNRWFRRITASMLDPYGPEGWLDDWSGGPFTNTLLLRNPGYEQIHLVSYRTVQRDGREVLADPLEEVGHAALIEGELPALRRSFQADPRVIRYFRDPGAAFDALLRLNDGGVTYIVEQLQAACDPQIKSEQIRGRLLREAAALLDGFGRFHDSSAAGSRDDRLRQSVAAMDSIGAALRPGGFAAFGRLLGLLTAREEALHGIYLSGLNGGAVEPAPPPVARPVEARSIFDDIEPSAASEPPAAAILDPDELFARRAVQAWVTGLRAQAAGGHHPLLKAVDRDALDFMIEQLIGAVHRLGVAAATADEVRSLSSVARGNWDRMASLAAGVAAARINGVVAALGYGDRPAAERPAVPPAPRKAVRRAFQPPEPFASMPLLGDRPRPITTEFAQDWMSAFVQLSLDNLGHAHEREITAAENAALGQLLDQARIQRRLGAA